MRTRWIALAIAAMFCGALGGAILAPQPADAVSREIIQLQQQVSQLIQGQQDLTTALASDTATLKTLVQQSLDSSNQLHNQMGSLQKVVQDMQANNNSTISTMSQQQQGLSDNLQDVQARVGKLAQQLNDIQSELQSIDSKVSQQGGGAPGGAVPNSGAAPGGAAPGMAPGAAPNGAPGTAAPDGNGSPAGPTAMNPAGPAGMAPISADTLYRNALRDYQSGNFDLSRQEFSDYIKNFPQNDLASNAQFYLGEIAYSQGNYKAAQASYEAVLQKYPQSLKLSASLYKKAMSDLKLGMRITARQDFREVVRRFPGSDEARRAEAELRRLEAPSAHTRR